MPQTVLLRLDVSLALGKYIRGRGSKKGSGVRRRRVSSWEGGTALGLGRGESLFLTGFSSKRGSAA